MHTLRLVEVFRTRDAIEEATPERCQPCDRPHVLAENLAASVVDGEMTVDEASEAHAQDVANQCMLGPAAVGSCMGNRLVCGYGGRDLTELELAELELALSRSPSTPVQD